MLEHVGNRSPVGRYHLPHKRQRSAVVVQPAPQLRDAVPLHAVHALAVQHQLARSAIVGTRPVPNAQQQLQPLPQQVLPRCRMLHVSGTSAQRSRQRSTSRCTRCKQPRASSALHLLLQERTICQRQLWRRTRVRGVLVLQPLPLRLRPCQLRSKLVKFKSRHVVQLLHLRTRCSFNLTGQRQELLVCDVCLAVRGHQHNVRVRHVSAQRLQPRPHTQHDGVQRLIRLPKQQVKAAVGKVHSVRQRVHVLPSQVPYLHADP